MKQKDAILMYMQEEGEITPVDALRELGCMRLAARISDLRREGHQISSRIVHDINRYGQRTHYAAYRLEVTA
jgi:hypothetical protein